MAAPSGVFIVAGMRTLTNERYTWLFVPFWSMAFLFAGALLWDRLGAQSEARRSAFRSGERLVRPRGAVRRAPVSNVVR